ncbi:MAG: hypothetical protein Greene041619_1260 [Candidatus Peregrinibacteria bacterium Greene0416_19]|nr:MAG: hypothetical protein Greene041619_1260 [Candidatus Peregrinibacteria bacterium Greene0416_19]
METTRIISALERHRNGETLSPLEYRELAKGLEQRAAELQLTLNIEEGQTDVRQGASTILSDMRGAEELNKEESPDISTEQLLLGLRAQDDRRDLPDPEGQIRALLAQAAQFNQMADRLEEHRPKQQPEKPAQPTTDVEEERRRTAGRIEDLTKEQPPEGKMTDDGTPAPPKRTPTARAA